MITLAMSPYQKKRRFLISMRECQQIETELFIQTQTGK